MFFNNRQFYLGYEAEKDELTGPCSTNGRDEKYSIRPMIERSKFFFSHGKVGKFFFHKPEYVVCSESCKE